MAGMRSGGDIGLVLSGGGAKGAFQAGVWKAMHELGLTRRVAAISGTSVGALNAAAFAAVRDPEEICRFWRNRVGEVATPYLRKLTLGSFRRAAENVLAGKAFPVHGLLDRRALERLVERRKAAAAHPRRKPSADIRPDAMKDLLARLHARLGTHVRLVPSVTFANGRRGHGRIEIDFADNDELGRLLELFGIDVNE